MQTLGQNHLIWNFAEASQKTGFLQGLTPIPIYQKTHHDTKTIYFASWLSSTSDKKDVSNRFATLQANASPNAISAE